MDALELVLVLLACVIVASLVSKIASRVSLPLIQIGVGFVCALIIPRVAHIEVDPELFLVLFIAPLLFNEAREASRAELWNKKWAVLSMAIGLVLITVLVVGFALHWLVPSIPLAAAFACAAALGPTDAAAVGALGSTVKLSQRQKTMLSGEALINDASGVVSFNFAIAAAVTGTFSVAEAGAEFAVLFFGGIAFGLVIGFVFVGSMLFAKARGLDDTVVNVLYEVFTPFVVYLAAEACGVSGILAVVAAGLVMARNRSVLVSAAEARNRMVSNAFWEVIVYLINGVVFVLLGMQLIEAFSPTLQANVSLPFIFLVIACVTALVVLVRFVWVSMLDLFAVDEETHQRGYKTPAHTLRNSLITTIAGPKGAVTLSIIFTIPATLADGSAFPERNLIIFLTAGVILLTLLIADIALPALAPSGDTKADNEALREGTIAVLKRTIKELEAKVAEGTKPEYEPATRLTIRTYRVRLAQERLAQEGCGDIMSEIIEEVARVQQNRADELQSSGLKNYKKADAAAYFAALRSIRTSIGYFGNKQKVGSRGLGLRGALYMARWRIPALRPKRKDGDQVYYETCLFAKDLEQTAIDYLTQLIKDEQAKEHPDEQRVKIARVIRESHQAALRSLDQRLVYGRDEEDASRSESAAAQRHFGEQFRKAREYAGAVNAGALSIELEQIRELLEQGEISPSVAQQLRETVYVLQMNLNV